MEGLQPPKTDIVTSVTAIFVLSHLVSLSQDQVFLETLSKPKFTTPSSPYIKT